MGAALGGAGVAGVGTSIAFFASTLSKVDESSLHCSSQGVCTQTGSDLRSEARDTQAAGFVALGVGVALVAAGVVLFVTSGSAGSPAKAARQQHGFAW
jgi:hypothetical protein